MFDNIKRFIQNKLGEKTAWRYLVEKQKFEEPLESPLESAWQNVFSKVPELKTWFKRREIQLLKSLITNEKAKDFINGQLFEIRFYKSFDVPNTTQFAKVEKEETKISTLDNFLKGWNKNNAEQGTKKEIKTEGSK